MSTSMMEKKHQMQIKARESCPTAFVKRYEASVDYVFPAGFDLAKNGILFVETIRTVDATMLLVYWTSAERARVLEPKIEKELGVANSQVVGEIVQIVIPRPPKWLENPAKWGQWVITAGAIFGALSVVQDHFTDLLGRPHAGVFPGVTAKRDFHAGERLDFPMEFGNQAASGRVDIHLDAVEIKPLVPSTPSLSLGPDIVDVRQIQAGQQKPVNLSGWPAPSNYSPLRRYTMVVKASAKEGTFWPSTQVKSDPLEIILWPDRMSESQVTRVRPNVVQVQINVGSGVAQTQGLRGQVTLISAASPEPGGIVMAGAIHSDEPIVAPGASGSLVKVGFQTGALQPFQPIPVTLTLSYSNALTESQWDQLHASTKVVVE